MEQDWTTWDLVAVLYVPRCVSAHNLRLTVLPVHSPFPPSLTHKVWLPDLSSAVRASQREGFKQINPICYT